MSRPEFPRGACRTTRLSGHESERGGEGQPEGSLLGTPCRCRLMPLERSALEQYERGYPDNRRCRQPRLQRPHPLTPEARALLVVCVGTLAASLLLGARFSWEICANDRVKQAELLQLTQQAAAEINRLLQPVSVAARGLAAWPQAGYRRMTIVASSGAYPRTTSTCGASLRQKAAASSISCPTSSGCSGKTAALVRASSVPFWGLRWRHKLNRMFTTSPSCTTYSLPSRRNLPCFLTSARLPAAISSS